MARPLRYHHTAGARTASAGTVVKVGLIALFVGALLNADSLTALADRQPFGWRRDVSRAAIAPFRWVSHGINLDRPRAEITDALGRDPVGERDAALPSTTVPTGPQTGPAIQLRRPTPADPLQVWIGGDSMTQVFGQSFLGAAEAEGDLDATLDYRISTGLTRPDYFNWPRHLVDDVLPDRPEVIVIMFGANDAQPMELDDGVVEVRTRAWQAEYRRRVGTTMDLLRGDGRLVVWVGQPNMRENDFDGRMEILNRIFEEEASGRPWVRFLDSRRVISPDGYAEMLRGTDLRQADGVHFTREGGDRLANAALDVIDREVEASTRPGSRPR